MQACCVCELTSRQTTQPDPSANPFQVLHKVLNAPYDLVYQLALLGDELTQIFDKAPPISAPDAAEANDQKRKPVEGDCPICFSEMDTESREAIVWCRAACGQNMHKDCFNMWAKSKPGEATCPFCRSTWEGDVDLANSIDLTQGRDSEGYINIRDQLPGISGVRGICHPAGGFAVRSFY